jgi:ubiquinone/menaquinone biosynthesis C-methylase UbiE
MAMLLNRSNRSINAAAVKEVLRVAPTRVLEIGFGGGVAVELLLAMPGTRVVALEKSAEMLNRARRHFAPAVASGQLDLREADVEIVPLPTRSVDAALSVNSIYFWSDQAKGLGEIYRVLAPGGRLVLGVEMNERAAETFARHGFHMLPVSEIENLLRDAQFVDLRPVEVARTKHVLVATKSLLSDP